MRLSHCALIAALLMPLGGCDRPSRHDDARPVAPQSGPEQPLALPVPADTVRTAEATGEKRRVAIAGADEGARVLEATDTALLPLARILEIARGTVRGEVIDVELDDEDGTPEYEITILTADNRSIEMNINARDGTIRKLEED
jgi:hypothetical protein